MTTIRAENRFKDTERTYGPFEWVQLTYDVLRIAPDGEDFATLMQGSVIPNDGTIQSEAWLFEDGFEATDLIIGSE